MNISWLWNLRPVTYKLSWVDACSLKKEKLQGRCLFVNQSWEGISNSQHFWFVGWKSRFLGIQGTYTVKELLTDFKRFEAALAGKPSAALERSQRSPPRTSSGALSMVVCLPLRSGMLLSWLLRWAMYHVTLAVVMCACFSKWISDLWSTLLRSEYQLN